MLWLSPALRLILNTHQTWYRPVGCIWHLFLFNHNVSQQHLQLLTYIPTSLWTLKGLCFPYLFSWLTFILNVYCFHYLDTRHHLLNWFHQQGRILDRYVSGIPCIIQLNNTWLWKLCGQRSSTILYYMGWMRNVLWFWFWWFLTKGLNWHLGPGIILVRLWNESVPGTNQHQQPTLLRVEFPCVKKRS